MHGSKGTGITWGSPKGHKVRPCGEWQDSRDAQVLHDWAVWSPQAVAINQASTILVIPLLPFTGLPAIMSVSILTYSFCSPVTADFSYLRLVLGSHGPCYLMASTCPPPLGVFSVSSCATKWLQTSLHPQSGSLSQRL